ncbi:hypothetical protein [Corynebacterium sp.]|uniref:hypothetical protein n=1 Tax=Corynebacterium sp. TaxID=1720 RepID=UPI0026DEE875|nr:hypothetical protein [Corynebacterium sp.]MDO5512470.1 hypothetical protein [Corynebacterium sp.]
MWAIRKVAAGALGAAMFAGLAPTPPALAGPQECPAVAVLAARGSDQNEQLTPTVYSPGSVWVSNGYEERTIRAFLHYAESRHPTLMRDVPVIALDSEAYPAKLPLPALAREDEDIPPLEMARRTMDLVRERPAHLIASDAVTGFIASVQAGVGNALDYVDDWEAQTGCAPGYILIGYSQGAAVLSAQERHLAERGQLVGSVYLGNPLLREGDVSVIGAPARGGGMLSSVPGEVQADSNRMNYCTTDDFSCDLTIDAALDALAAGGGVHTRYFLDDPTDHDELVADTFAGWITGYTPSP